MYCILNIADYVFSRVHGSWRATAWSGSASVYNISILDYSDWSINSVPIDVVMHAIEIGDLGLDEFINLRKVDDHVYRIGNASVFSKNRFELRARGVTLRLNSKFMKVDVLLDSDRCFSIGVSDSYLELNYMRMLAFSLGGMDAMKVRNLRRTQDGKYVFYTCINKFCFTLHQNLFVVNGMEFDYISKAELARKHLMYDRYEVNYVPSCG